MLILILRPLLHYSFHLLLPGLIAWHFYHSSWKKSWLVLLATMLVDLDHLVATPIFDSNRCSIGYHFLHSYPAILVYILMLIPPKTRLVAIGLVLHMLTDYLDCCWLK